MFKTPSYNKDGLDRRLSVAPMMDWTDRHCRYFHRLLSPNALLFTEMVTAEAILHAGADRFCAHHLSEHPLALQLGGSEPHRLAAATRLVRDFGFDEINLNVGCPSPRVKAGCFGASLMAEPKLVAECVRAMQGETDRPVTVKCRIGIDDMDVMEGLNKFVDAQAEAGVKIIYLHARKAWLNGLSPKENREVPPLDYGRASQLAADYPDLDIILNGGLETLEDIQSATEAGLFCGVMIGRAAYKTPRQLGYISSALFGHEMADLSHIAQQMSDYAEKEIEKGVRLHNITRHMLGLFTGLKCARTWRRTLGEQARDNPTAAALIAQTAQTCLALQGDTTNRKVA
ncbi:MAG: tRNA dihydrouridine(20/20a) synthase DusA [Alphaproteobacteria bacterium]|nr:tRNA dihydrouridine(20/20a) synthase DusA [Alphaproteobacteria bacterium]